MSKTAIVIAGAAAFALIVGYIEAIAWKAIATTQHTANGEATMNAKRTMPNVEPMLQFFAYEHLPGHLQPISRPFAVLADWMVNDLPRNPERTAGLRKLLEAKDCAVRACIYKDAEAT